MKVPPIYRPRFRHINAPIEFVAPVVTFAIIGFVSLFFIKPLLAAAFTTLVLLYANRNIYRSYRNNHTEYTTIEVNVIAKDKTHHIMDYYDGRLSNVKADVVSFLQEASGVTPMTSKIWQRDSSEGGPFGTGNRRDATITVKVGYDLDTVDFVELQDNLEKAVRNDDRIGGFRSVKLGSADSDLRDSIDSTSDDYRQLGRDTGPKNQGLSEEDEELVRKAEREYNR